jgi:hypothetical protein
MEVSSGEDDVTKKSVGDDAGDGGASSAEPIAPNPISSNVSEQVDPSIIDQVTSTDPPASERRCKRPSPVSKQNQSSSLVDQVMTHIELPPYHGPQSPLDLVAIEIMFGRLFEEIMFGCLFEAFQHTSQVAGTSTSADDDTQPQKKMH